MIECCLVDFERGKCNETLMQTWNEFRDALSTKEFKYDDIEKAKRTKFLKVYDDIFHKNSGILSLETSLGAIAGDGFVRGAVLKADEVPDYERFIPKKEFIRLGNRFSPPDLEYLYLAMGSDDEAVECAQKECKAEDGDRFGYCHFEINQEMYASKIVNLTMFRDLSYEEIDAELENCTGRGSEHIIAEWAFRFYTKMLSEKIFVRLDTEDKDLEYAPFQTLAQYYSSLDYLGIIYESTVSEKGRNIVLFDKDAARPAGEIRIIP